MWSRGIGPRPRSRAFSRELASKIKGAKAVSGSKSSVSRLEEITQVKRIFKAKKKEAPEENLAVRSSKGDNFFMLNRKLTKSKHFVQKLKDNVSQSKLRQNQEEKARNRLVRDGRKLEEYRHFVKSKKKVKKTIRKYKKKAGKIKPKRQVDSNFQKLEKVPIFKLKNSKNLFEKISSLLPILKFQKVKREFLRLELEAVIGVSNKGSEWPRRVHDFFFVVDKKCQIGKKKKFFYFVEKVVVVFYESLNLQHFYLDHQHKVD